MPYQAAEHRYAQLPYRRCGKVAFSCHSFPWVFGKILVPSMTRKTPEICWCMPLTAASRILI